MSDETEHIQDALAKLKLLFNINKDLLALTPETPIDNVIGYFNKFENMDERKNLRVIYFDFLRRIEAIEEVKRAKYHFFLGCFRKLRIAYEGIDVINMFKDINDINKDHTFKYDSAYHVIDAEELQENLFRDQKPMHDIFNGLEDELKPAVRLLLGAFTSGDISKTPQEMIECIKRVCEKNNKLEKNKSDKEKFVFNDGKNNSFQEWLNTIVNKRLELYIDKTMLSPLSSYLKGRKILLIEDKYPEHAWDIALPLIFGCSDIEFLFKNPSDAMKNLEDTLKTFDIILLDLYSSENKHKQYTISEPLIDFIELIEKLYEDSNDLVPVALPRIVIFSSEDTGPIARTMLKNRCVSDYFFKITEIEFYKSGYYSAFRNALITALKETVVHVLGEQHVANPHIFNNNWLPQFLPEHRPLILRIMKHFRYYSAMSIVSTMNEYLQCSFKCDNNNKMSLLCSDYYEPDCFWFSYLGRANKSGAAMLPLLSKTKFFKKLKEEIKKQCNNDKVPQFMTYDKLQDELKKLIEKKRVNHRLCIIFVDDVTSSGGQLESYIWKFVNDHLKKKMLKSLWKLICSRFMDKGDNKIEIHVFFIIGTHFKDFEDMLPNNERDGSHLTGTYSVCTNEKHKNRKDVPCDCPETIPVRVHVADYTKNIEEICIENNIPFEEVKNILSQYNLITHTREKEYPCDFEPLGWKGCRSLFATYANAPGNTLPIIWAGDSKQNEWIPLFVRFFNPLLPGDSEQSQLPCKSKNGNGFTDSCTLSDYFKIEDSDRTFDKPPCKA